MNLRKLLFKLEKHGDGKAPQPRADLDLIGTASVQHRGLKPKVIWLYESHLASPSTSLCLVKALPGKQDGHVFLFLTLLGAEEEALTSNILSPAVRPIFVSELYCLCPGEE